MHLYSRLAPVVRVWYYATEAFNGWGMDRVSGNVQKD